MAEVLTTDLRESEEKYRIVFENEIYAICIFDLETLALLEVNKAYEHVYGYSREELLSGMTIHDITAEQEASDVSTVQAIHEGTIFVPLRHHRKKDGTIFPVEIVGGPYVWRGRRVMFALAHDITVRKRAEEALQISEQKHRQLFETMSQGVIYYDAGGRILSANPAAEQILGFSLDSMTGQTYQAPKWKVLREDDSPLPAEAHPIAVSLRTGRRVDGQIIKLVNPQKDKKHWLSISAIPLFHDGADKPYQLYSTFEDITERKHAEEAMNEAYWRLESIIEGTQVGTWEWNIQTGETIFNEKWVQIIGYTLDELAPTSIETWGKFTHPDDLKISGELLARHFAGELPNYDCEARMKHKDGHWVWVHDRGLVFTRTDDGKPLMMFGTHQDITERKRMEENLRISFEKYRVLFESFPLGISITDQTGAIVETNRAAEKLLAVPTDVQTGRAIDSAEWRIVRLDGTPMPPDEYASVRALKEQRIVENVEMGIVKGKDAITWINVTSAPIPLSGYGVAIAYDDITERKQAQDALAQARDAAEAANRAKSLFLAHMSHELRTPLNAILGFSELMASDPKFDDEDRGNLTIINRSGEHLLNLINEVLDMAKIESGKVTVQGTTSIYTGCCGKYPRYSRCVPERSISN